MRTATGNVAKAVSIEALPELLDFTELLDFGALDEEDLAELLLDPVALLQDDEDFGALDEEDFATLLLDFGTLDDEDFTTLLLDCETPDDEDFGALEELETLEELELLGAVTTASKLSINLSETDLFNTGYLSLSDCVQAEPSNP